MISFLRDRSLRHLPDDVVRRQRRRGGTGGSGGSAAARAARRGSGGRQRRRGRGGGGAADATGTGGGRGRRTGELRRRASPARSPAARRPSPPVRRDLPTGVRHALTSAARVSMPIRGPGVAGRIERGASAAPLRRTGKRRPVVVISRAGAIDLISTVMVAPVTSTIRGLPSEVPLDATDGMKRTLRGEPRPCSDGYGRLGATSTRSTSRARRSTTCGVLQDADGKKLANCRPAGEVGAKMAPILMTRLPAALKKRGIE